MMTKSCSSRNIRVERDKREKIARTRAQKNEKLLEKFQKQMIEYETEILKLKDNNEVAKLKSMTANAQASLKTAVVPPGSKADKQLTDLQAEVKKNDKLQKDVQKLKETAIKHTTERKELNAQVEKVEQKRADEENKAAKYAKDKDEALKALSQARNLAEVERYEKARHKEDFDKLLAERQGTGAGAGMGYSDMANKLKELENDVYVLEAQKKTVIAYNPRTSTFEYIGEPVALNKDAALKNVEDIIDAMKVWLARPVNDRLSVQQIFESLDIENHGELSAKNFESALSRLGIHLTPSRDNKQGELQLLKDVLDQRHVGYLHYRSLVRELNGVPQLDFMNKAIIKLAKIAEEKDLS